MEAKPEPLEIDVADWADWMSDEQGRRFIPTEKFFVDLSRYADRGCWSVLAEGGVVVADRELLALAGCFWSYAMQRGLVQVFRQEGDDASLA